MPSVFAFDGKRKGFVIGGGLGFSPYNSIKSSDNHYLVDFKSSGLALNSHIGYAWDEYNQILFEESFSSLNLKEEVGEKFDCSFVGPVWYHYFSKPGRTFYSTFGVGYYFFSTRDNHYKHNKKTGLIFGSGFEFRRHFQINVRYVYVKSDYAGWNFKHNHLNFTVTGSFY